jgi:hypothetical protein
MKMLRLGLLYLLAAILLALWMVGGLDPVFSK